MSLLRSGPILSWNNSKVCETSKNWLIMAISNSDPHHGTAYDPMKLQADSWTHEWFKEVTSIGKDGRRDGRTENRTGGRMERRQFQSAPMTAECKNVFVLFYDCITYVNVYWVWSYSGWCNWLMKLYTYITYWNKPVSYVLHNRTDYIEWCIHYRISCAMNESVNCLIPGFWFNIKMTSY